MDDPLCIGVRLTVVTNAGVHRHSPVQYTFNRYVNLSPDTRRAPATTNASNLHGEFVEVGATLLGSTTRLTSGSFRSLASSSHNVSFTFILAIVHSLIDRFLACSKHPLWKELISGTLAVGERNPLITRIFSDRDEIETVMDIFGDDAQTLIDTIAGVSPRTSRSALIQTFILCRLGIGQPRARDPQRELTLFIQDLWPPSPASNTIGNSPMLRPDGEPATPRWICGCVEGPIPRSGCGGQGSEGAVKG